ncbi:cysteinyl leukotriene receptor 1-like [Cloeon dipterum]|uniref:cysteinyl leukotriene receptor 1-like n=1 Tax=Cloeon dipterum TaxID=197152 RepID=UPI00321F801B
METAELSDFQITGISIFSVLSVATAASNLLTIIAVFRCKREFWSTAFVFIFVQAVADILISCTVPILIYLTVDYSSLRSEQEWNFGKLVKNSNRICKMIFIPIIWHFFFSWTNIVLLTFDRLVAAGYPEAHEKSITKRWVGIACTFGLFISMICTRFVIQTMDTPCKHNQCYTPDTMLARTFSPATFKIAVLPCYFVIIVLFIVVLTEIPTYRRDHSWTKVKTLKMLAILLLLFIIGWLPFLTVMLAYLSNLMPHEYIMKAFLCSFISIGFKCLTTPSAYLIGLHNFKVALKQVYSCKKTRHVHYANVLL